MLKSIMIISAGVSLLISCSTSPESSATDSLMLNEPDSIFVNQILDFNDRLWTEIIFKNDGIFESMAYADSSNFIGQRIYPCARCFLRPEAAKALLKANSIAKTKGLGLLLFDCYRPAVYQQKMFDIVEDPRYVAEPKKGGSMHNKGLAVDIALTDSLGNILDFGGNFDDFSERSHHSFKNLDSLAIYNRILLKGIMAEAGFTFYPFEWWHYSYTHVDYDLDDYVWGCN
ncbi:M15 family metallopeptidase [Acidiluteibacter ferrifornacis]|uniref:D-alanyl-D-alanine dipeptidase n=1 Tax=Acidiluteibacter ferrifornacis TaxID=2692424 RepID=A0A6N9NHX5_9FLAO|nr:M15 family metallopeptidase [Acidiluteibacter ferrifornacis]NBG65503.1 peptidase M15 [Acidiluteibacter ferrifornacis]